MTPQSEFPELFSGKVGKLKQTQIKLHIDSSVPPVKQKHRRLPLHLRMAVEAELARLEKEDLIERVPPNVPIPWISPIVIIIK
jgi:hypothetical protein